VVTSAVTVKASATAPSGAAISAVQFLLNGNSLGSAVTSTPYTMNWNTASVANGTYSLAATATDSTGASATSPAVAVTVNNGSVTNPLTVTITAPANGSTVSGTVTMTATASDSNAVTGIQFAVDGTNVGPVIASPPYSTTWNTSGAAAGGHTITATATDSAANTASANITVTIASTSNPPPPPPPGGSGWTKLKGTMLKGGSENASPCPPDGFDGYDPLPAGYADQCQYVIESWNSAIPDPARNRLIIWGGGHDDYGGNEVYSLELGQTPPTLIRLDPPSPPNTQSGVCVETLSDNRPNSRHTYDSLIYFPTQDEMFAFGGALNDCGYPGSGVWTLNLASVLASCAPNCTSSWTQLHPTTTPDAEVGVTSGYDSTSGLGYLATQDEFLSFNPATNQFTMLNGNASLGYHSTGLVDPVDGLFIVVDSNVGAREFSLSTGAETTPSVDSSCSGLLNNTNYNGNSGYVGLAWDPISNAAIGYPNGGNVIYVLNPKTWTCTTETYGSTQGTDYPQNDVETSSSGTFKHFNYISSLDEFVLCNDPYNDCWVLHRPRSN
jgi:Bacterial Ig domain